MGYRARARERHLMRVLERRLTADVAANAKTDADMQALRAQMDTLIEQATQAKPSLLASSEHIAEVAALREQVAALERRAVLAEKAIMEGKILRGPVQRKAVPSKESCVDSSYDSLATSREEIEPEASKMQTPVLPKWLDKAIDKMAERQALAEVLD